jgi:hypothetical protein
MKKVGGDLFYCVCMILATPVCILLAVGFDAQAGRAVNPRAAQHLRVMSYVGAAVSLACPVMAVLLWWSWRKTRVERAATAATCPMCGAPCVMPGRCSACGETFSVVKPPAPNPDGPFESN